MLFTPTLRVYTHFNAVQKVYETQVCDLEGARIPYPFDKADQGVWKTRGNAFQSKELEGAVMAHWFAMAEIYAEANPSDGDEYWRIYGASEREDSADLGLGAEIDMSPEDYEPNPYDGTYSEM